MSLFGRRADEDAPARPSLAVAEVAPMARAAGLPVVAMAAPGPAVLTSPDQAVSAVVSVLTAYLTPVAGLPDPTAVVLQVSDRTLGLGNSRGLEPVGPFSAVELYGGQIDCVVRLQVWGTDSAAANEAMTSLQGRLLGARADLFDAGFLQFDGVAGTLPVAELNAWSRTADYHALVEYHLAPTSNADSLIAAIPIDAEQEIDGSLVDERTTVTGDAVRWDQVSARGLVVRGRRSIDTLAVAAFLPAPQPTGALRIVRTSDDATTAPLDYATLDAFLAAVNDPVTPERNGRFSFGSLAAFVAALDDSGSLLLGDWDQDGNPDGYVVGELALNPPIPLAGSTDRLEISLQTSPLDHTGVVYLRAARALT